MKKLLISFAVFSLFFLTACDNTVQQIFKEAPLAFTDNIEITAEKITLTFAPNKKKASNYEVKYSIQETGGDTVNETQTMENISEGSPIVVTIDDLKPDAAYFTGIMILNEEGIEVYKFQEKIEPNKNRSVENVGIANPASVFCENHGGILDIREDKDGRQFGMCVFENGQECEEWAFMRGECTEGE